MIKIKIDKNKCIGCGSCVYTMQDTFMFDDYGKAESIKETNNVDLEELETVRKNCPAKAIKILKK